jgi:hypothetical protein
LLITQSLLILNLLVEKFPDGYDDSIVRFRNAKNELIEAVGAHR